MQYRNGLGQQNKVSHLKYSYPNSRKSTLHIKKNIKRQSQYKIFESMVLEVYLPNLFQFSPSYHLILCTGNDKKRVIRGMLPVTMLLDPHVTERYSHRHHVKHCCSLRDWLRTHGIPARPTLHKDQRTCLDISNLEGRKMTNLPLKRPRKIVNS